VIAIVLDITIDDTLADIAAPDRQRRSPFDPQVQRDQGQEITVSSARLVAQVP
jgi:hypothetical protein